MLRRFLIIFFLPLLFLIAQHGAVTHEISHFSEPAPLSQQKQQAPHNSVCDKCNAYGELANSLQAVGLTVAVIQDTIQHSDEHCQFYRNHSFDSYQARAPPYFS